MPDPMPLKFTATLVCMRALLLENTIDTSDDNITGPDEVKRENGKYLTRLLETECFTAVSEEILQMIVKYCPDNLSGRLLHALAPMHIKDLNLINCSNIVLTGLVKTFAKCKHIHRVNLSCCSQLVLPELFTFLGLTRMPLTTVILENNPNVTDDVVHTMLGNLPGLETLNISSCPNISNEVFLMDKGLQRAREVSPHPLKDDEYKCNLTDVDISGCRQLDAVTVNHLVSLCGPKLRSVNISWTTVNCTGLLHLAGYSLPAIIDIMLTVDALKSDKELKMVLQHYRELRDTYAELYGKPSEEDNEQRDEHKSCEDCNSLDEIEVNEHTAVESESGEDMLLETDIILQGLESLPECTGNEEGEKDTGNIVGMVDELSLKEGITKCNGNMESESKSEAIRKRVFYRNGEVVAVECSVHGENCESEDEDDMSENFVKESLKDGSSDSKNCDTKQNKNPPKPVAAATSDKLSFDYAAQLYQPKISNLNICGIQYVSRRPYLGQICLEKFLVANKGLKKFSVSWKGLTLEFFRKVVQNLTELVEVELEECTLLQSGGVEALGTTCCNLQSVNLRGIVFIYDGALVPFLSNKNLKHLQLAESTLITDAILIKLSKHLSESLTSIDLSFCEEITEKGVNAICSSCSNLRKICLHKCPVSDFTLRILSETAVDLVEISVESADTNGDSNITDEGILTVATCFKNLRVLDISWNLYVTDLSISAVMLNCCRLEEANFKGLKMLTIQPFLPIISGETGDHKTEDTAVCASSVDLPPRSTVYAPSLRVLDLDYSDLVNDQLLQKIVNVCRGTLQATDYYGQKLEPEKIPKSG